MLRVDGEIRSFQIPRYFFEKLEKDICPEYFVKWRDAKRVELLEKRRMLVEKGDGPLRRARAKGRIFNHISKKRRDDESGKGSVKKIERQF